MTIKYSCVVDDNPLLQAQTFIWLNCLLQLAEVKPEDIYVHTIGRPDEQFTQLIEQFGVKRVAIDPFNRSNKYCNKLGQLSTFTEQSDFDYVVLMDCDTAVAGKIEFSLVHDVYAKIVDFPRPPIARLRRIFKAAGVGEVEAVPASFPIDGERLTDYNNCNGGVYLISRKIFAQLAKEWQDYANWSFDNIALYGDDFSHHIDQVSFALALTKLGVKVNHLAIEWNYPTHLKKRLLPNVTPRIIHYHAQVDEHLKLIPPGIANVDSVIGKINEVISESNRRHFANSLFWNIRYKRFPDLGSGVGSRGDYLTIKRSLIANSIYDPETKSVIDLGCGDLEVLRVFNFKEYLGIDVSENAIKIARTKRPGWDFACGDVRSMDLKQADVVICLDVLIHQPSEGDYASLVKCMAGLCTDRLIIGAYNYKPSAVSEITFYYEPIVKTLETIGMFKEINVVGTYRDVSVVVATKDSGQKHQRDIGHEEYNLAARLVGRGDLLRRLVDLSRGRLGFFTKHFTRTIEYTWLAEKMESGLDGKRVLDVGAGVSPLPLHFAERGAKVITVDLHRTVRRLEKRSEWNEWGYLDYGAMNPRIKSHNKNVLKLMVLRRMDVIYSISVIEHVPQKQRVEILKKLRRLLKKNGKVFLTIDLVPNSDRIWTHSEGKEIESSEVHGTITSFMEEVKQAKFDVASSDVRRDIPHSQTDVLFVELQRT